MASAVSCCVLVESVRVARWKLLETSIYPNVTRQDLIPDVTPPRDNSIADTQVHSNRFACPFVLCSFSNLMLLNLCCSVLFNIPLILNPSIALDARSKEPSSLSNLLHHS